MALATSCFFGASSATPIGGGIGSLRARLEQADTKQCGKHHSAFVRAKLLIQLVRSNLLRSHHREGQDRQL
jgi:hypothetical protein